MYATAAVLAALYHRDVNGGVGQHIDLALFDTAPALMTSRAQEYWLLGKASGRIALHALGSAPAGVYATLDGAINIQAGDQRGFEKLCEILGLQVIVGDPRFKTRTMRFSNRLVLNGLIGNAIAGRHTVELK